MEPFGIADISLRPLQLQLGLLKVVDCALAQIAVFFAYFSSFTFVISGKKVWSSLNFARLSIWNLK